MSIKRVNQGFLFFSNRLEKLLLHLRANLFFENSSPFTERIVVVPSLEMERWIRLRLADEMGVAAGIQIYSLTQALVNLCDAKKPPPPIELAIHLEEALHKHLEDPLFKPVKSYLKGREKRRMILAKQLSFLFLRYSIYGVSTWNHPWQKKLWDEIGFAWNVKPTEKATHLFGFSHIPPQFFPLFQSFLYVLSPCREFWSEEVTHPLLADLGFVGRGLAAQIEESTLHVVEDYEQEGLSPTQVSMLHLEGLEDDPSIEFHVATTAHREVEICYDNLLPLFEKVHPRDVLVMAPNISKYAHLIEAVFGSLCQITDLPTISIDLEVKGFWLLLEMEKKRWSAPALLELFRHPLLQKKKGWNEERILTVRRWMETTGIRWGVDPSHREKILGKRSEDATIKQGVDQLIEDLAYGSDRISLTDGELLGDFIQTVDEIYSGLKPLYDGTRWGLKKWVSHFKNLYETHFAFDKQTLFDTLDKLVVPSEKKYSGEMLFPLLEQVLKVEEATYNSNETEAVRFCSLLPMRAIPAKVIYLLGMNQDQFPRQEETFSLDEAGGAPKKTDLDRYLFLEALLSYREKLFISYLDTGIEPPSSVLQKMKGKRIIHPPTSHDRRYFTEEEGLNHFSKRDFVLAKAASQAAEKEVFFHSPKTHSIPPGEHHLSLNELLQAIRFPVAHFFHELSFYEEAPLKEEEEFTLTPLQRSKFHRLSLKMAPEIAMGKMQKEGNFPTGPFAKLGFEKIKKIKGEEKELSVTVQIDQQTTVEVKGVVSGITPEGIFRFEKCTFPNAIKIWPAYLLHAVEKSVPLILGEKTLPPFFTSPLPYLKTLISYYFLSRQMASPLFPHWVEPILKGKGDFSTYDTAMQWVLQTKQLGDEIFAWKGIALDLFGEMKDAWF